MTFLRTYLADRAVQSSDAASFRQDMPRTGVISAIELGVRITNGATSGLEIIPDAIDRIEVLANGSFPLVSLTGRSAYALASLFLKRRPPQVRSEAAAGVQEAWFLIPFGFTIWSPQGYLDLARYQQVQLVVTYSPTISATAFATGTTTFTVKTAQWSQDSVPGGGGGYIRSREIFSFDTGASGDQQVLLPTEFPLLGLLILSREAAIAIETDLTRVRLLDKIGGSELYNRRTEDAMAENDEELGLEAIERGLALRADAEVLNTDVNMLQSVAFTPNFALTATSLQVFAFTNGIVGDQVTLAVNELADAAADTHATLSTTIRTLRWVAMGRGLPHAIYLPLHHWGRPETAYQAQQRDQLVLLLTQGGAGANVRVNALEWAA
jgi:hypothetical protein